MLFWYCQSCGIMYFVQPIDDQCKASLAQHDYENGWTTNPCGGMLIKQEIVLRG